MSRKKRKGRRDITVFSLSFLDCICCGFGALILLFVISLGSDRVTLQEIRDRLQLLYQQRMAELAEKRVVKEETVQRLASERDTLAMKEKTAARLETEIEQLLRRIKEAEFGQKALLAEIDQTQGQIEAREKPPEIEVPQVDPDLPVGVPVASNHIVFILDTSGSMRDPSSGEIWPFIIDKVSDTLDAYPIVTGVQVMDANGNYMVPGTGGQWIPDSPRTREGIKNAMRRYDRFSRSNPVPAILKSIKVFGDNSDPTKRVGLFVFGDEFTETAAPVIARVAKLNTPNEKGVHPVTINAIGFPHVIKNERHFTQTGLKFANLMRELTYQNGGAFVGMEN